MIRFRLKELLADKSFREGRVIPLTEVASETGIHRLTLSKVANQRGYNAGADVMDRLCAYFGCRLEDLAQYLPDDAVPPPTGKLGHGPKDL